ncbi:hypothetical protein KAS79_01480 [Candidatus Parcubacteria bacterium]|nr:hypothetical protein [Candidatus Parcubacteria bacterium]
MGIAKFISDARKEDNKRLEEQIARNLLINWHRALEESNETDVKWYIQEESVEVLKRIAGMDVESPVKKLVEKELLRRRKEQLDNKQEQRMRKRELKVKRARETGGKTVIGGKCCANVK